MSYPNLIGRSLLKELDFTVEEWIDKDHVGALAAKPLEADLFVVLTNMPAVMADFGTALAELSEVVAGRAGTQVEAKSSSVSGKAGG